MNDRRPHRPRMYLRSEGVNRARCVRRLDGDVMRILFLPPCFSSTSGCVRGRPGFVRGASRLRTADGNFHSDPFASIVRCLFTRDFCSRTRRDVAVSGTRDSEKEEIAAHGRAITHPCALPLHQ